MKKQLLLATPIVLSLAACSHHIKDDYKAVSSVAPQVSVVEGRIRAPSVVIVSKGQPKFTITWQLFDSQFIFPENGIVIDGEVVFPTETVPDSKDQSTSASSLRVDVKQRSNFKCARHEEGRKFSCTSDLLLEGIYKYTVRVQGPGGSPALRLDPPIIIMKTPS